LERAKTLIVTILGLILGAGLANIPIRLTGSSSEGTLLGILFCAIGLTALRPGARWVAGLSVGVGMVALLGFLIFHDVRVQADFTQGKLLDFGLGVMEAMVPAFFGIILGTALVRAMPRAATLGVLMIFVAYGAVYLWSDHLHEQLVKNEISAHTKMLRLVEAQESYRLSNEDQGYSCSLSDLGQEFENMVEFSPQYSARYSRATDGIFIYDLVCMTPGTPMDKYVIVARTPPTIKTSRYAYCANESGQVRKVDRRRATFCLPDGLIPPGKMVDMKTFMANKKSTN
jgi:hypothetical protein